jgi:hypothetical protein
VAREPVEVGGESVTVVHAVIRENGEPPLGRGVYDGRREQPTGDGVDGALDARSRRHVQRPRYGWLLWAIVIDLLAQECGALP